MALNGDVKPEDEELNIILKSLAERGKEGEIFEKYNEYFAGDFILPRQLFTESNNSEIEHDHNILRAYGSAAEDLQFYDPCDAGDIDLMVFSNSENLIIHEERLEYSLENPLHVRIKGSDHPVFQSCLVKDTEYVATAALRNFSPAIFGTSVLFLVDVISAISLISSDDGFPFRLTAQVKKNENSPAMTICMSHLLGTISKYKELLKVDLQSVSNNDVAAEMECVIHFLLGFNGIDYTREHAEIVNDLSSLMKAAACNSDKDVPFFVLMLDIFNNMKKLCIRLRETASRSKNKILANGDHKNVTQETGDKCSGQTTTENCSQQSCAPVKPRSCKAYPDHRPPTVFKGPSTMNKNSAIQEFSNNPISRQRSQGDGVEDKSEEKENWDSKGDEDKSNTKRKPEAKREGLTYGEGNEAKGQNEESELERKLSRWFEGILAVKTNEPHEKQPGDTERVKNGIDLIPAFRSHGWPKAAREWIKKDRKWPSPDIVSKVINEGYHLVSKSAKKSGNRDCDFRLSFSHAEYLLSQEMNDIQRDCYICLKKIHRAYLCTRPKSLVSFHLKNILLHTIEEAGAEMWTDTNRAECMMVLLRKLLTALATKDLRHFFVRSYNLFGVDYIENPQSLEFLAMRVEEIVENPMRFSKQLIQNRDETREETKEECVLQKIFPEGDQSSSLKPAHATRCSDDNLEESPYGGSYATQIKKENEAIPLLSTKVVQKSCSPGSYRYHDLKDVYQEVTEELIRLASHENEDKVAAMDALEMSVVKDFTQLVRKYNIPVEVFPGLCNALWHKRAYYWVWISTEPNIRRRVLVAIRGGLQLLKHHLTQHHFREEKKGETFEAFFDRIFDPAIENPFHLDHELPSDNFLKLMYKVANSFRNSSVKDLREMGETYFDLTDPDVRGYFDLVWEAWEAGISNESDAEYRLLSKYQLLVQSAMVHWTKEDEDQQGENNNLCENLYQRLLGAVSSFIAGKIRQNVAKNSGGIPLD